MTPDSQIDTTMITELLQHRFARDLVRDDLVREFKKLKKLPPALQRLAEMDDALTDAFRREFVKHKAEHPEMHAYEDCSESLLGTGD
jgi:hypothetical protein